MKKLIYYGVAGVALVASSSYAQDVGKVLSSTPLVRQVATPRQVCRTETVAVQAPKSGAGALVGAIAGGAIGNAIGNGGGRAATTMLGIVGGSLIGDKIEGSSSAQWQQVQRCEWQQVFENQTVGYQVVYEYAGKQYSVEWPTEPGPTIPLQVHPTMPITTPAPHAMVIKPRLVVVDEPVVYTYSYDYPPPVRVYWGPGRWPNHYGNR